MEKRLIISGLCLLCLLFARCSDPFAKEQFVAYDQQPIGLYLETVPEYSDWVKLLKKADLFNAVNINLKYTCFVANNQALQTYIQTKNPNWRTVDDLTEDEASNLMKYHIIPGMDYSFGTLQGKIGTRTVSDDYLTATINEDGTKRFINGVEIVKRDNKLINGYVQELAAVLDPILYTIMEVLEQSPEYSIITQALKECKLDEYLALKEIVVNNVKLRDYKTIIVPSDSVFNAAGINTIQDLRQKFAGEPTDVKSDFYKFVGYHVFSKAMDYGDLTDFPIGIKGQNIETYVSREFITIIQDASDEIQLNPGGEEILRFVPEKFNIPGSNGYIHEVSGIMPISDPIRYPMVWEPTEYDEFRTIPFYRTPKVKGSTNTSEWYFFDPIVDKVEHFRWKTIPFKDEVLAYLSEDVDWDRFMNDDCFYVNLGPVGWIEFDTPTLMRGKYQIEMVKWSWGASGDKNIGKFQMYIDEQKFGPIISNSQAPGTPNLGVFRFEESGAHVFRFNVVGDDGKGNSHLYIDRFIFTPVN